MLAAADITFITSSDVALTVGTADPLTRGTYSITLVHTLTNYPNTVLYEHLADVHLIDACYDYNQIVVEYDSTSATSTGNFYDYILGYTDPIQVTVPTYYDTQSQEQGTTNVCGPITVTTVVYNGQNEVAADFVQFTTDSAGLEAVTFSPSSTEASSGSYIVVLVFTLESTNGQEPLTVYHTQMEVNVIDMCLNGNYVIVEEHDVVSPQDYTINVSDDLAVPLGSISDFASTELDITNFCGDMISTMTIEQNGVAVTAAASSFIVYSPVNN